MGVMKPADASETLDSPRVEFAQGSRNRFGRSRNRLGQGVRRELHQRQGHGQGFLHFIIQVGIRPARRA